MEMLYKARKIIEQNVELQSFENLMYEKIKEKEKVKENIKNFEDVFVRKKVEFEKLHGMINDSEVNEVILQMKIKFGEMEQELGIKMECCYVSRKGMFNSWRSFFKVWFLGNFGTVLDKMEEWQQLAKTVKDGIIA